MSWCGNCRRLAVLHGWIAAAAGPACARGEASDAAGVQATTQTDGSADPSGSSTTSKSDSATSTTGSTPDGTSAADSISGSSGDVEPEAVWSDGEAPTIVAPENLEDLPGGLAGEPLWVSNNPEVFTGLGWLMQHARPDPDRGGVAMPVQAMTAYLFHINGTGSDVTLHVVASNPNTTAVTVSATGALYTNADHPLLGEATGPSYAVAQRALTGSSNIDVDSRPIPSSTGVEIASIPLSPNAMVDGRIAIDATGPVYLYTSVTQTGSSDDGINATQQDPAPGTIAAPGPNAYGRMAGIYEHDRWDAEVALDVPAAPAHIAFALDTSSKFALDGVTLQEQTAESVVNLDDSSTRSYGNYGLLYDLRFELCADAPREIGIYLASHVHGPDIDLSFSWNGPVELDGQIVSAFTTPTEPRALLDTLKLDGGCRDVRLRIPVPGLITSGAQLQLESR